MMLSLYLGYALLAVATIALVLLALRGGQLAAGSDLYREAQRGFYRQRLSEIAADFDAGMIDLAQREVLELELDRQVLEESQEARPRDPARPVRRRWIAPVLGLLVVATGGAIYEKLGYRDDLVLKELQRELLADGDLDRAEIDQYQALLARIVERHPDSADHLVAMAGLLKERGDFAGAVPYYTRLQALFPKDPSVLAQLGQARFMAAGRQMDAETRAILEQAIEADPQQYTALGVLGIDAFSQRQFVEALKYWQPLLAAMPPGSPQQGLIAAGVNEAKKQAVQQGLIFGVPVTIVIDSAALETNGQGFLVAREPEGIPMPVAAVKLPPLQGTQLELYLTDSDVIRQGMQLRDFAKLSLSAHISTSGTAIRRPGDWGSAAVDIATVGAEGVTLRIDRH